MSHPTFEAPGPGSWELDDSHFSGAMPRYDRDRYADHSTADTKAQADRETTAHAAAQSSCSPLDGPGL